MKCKLLIVFALMFSLTIAAQSSKNENAARVWLNNPKNITAKPFESFRLSFVRKSLSGETLRFQQQVNDVDVFGSEVVVHFSTKNNITNTQNGYDSKVENTDVNPSISKAEAIAISDKALKVSGEIPFQECKLFVYNKLSKTKLVYRVITHCEFIKGSWEVIIDAKTAEVLSKKDIAFYNKHKPKPKKRSNTVGFISATSTNFVSGTGLVFNPDPLSFAQVPYAGNYSDNNNATNTSLNAARVSIVLPEIEFANNVYKLKGTYVEIKSLEAPSTGLFTQATSVFNFTRAQLGFEAVNAYYHLDNSLRYINETLGIVCRPLNHAGVLWYDPHAVNGDDNSFYSNGELHFGQGGVDDAEDADVILHELGHGLHDWITNNGLSQVNGLSEGCGDYWAASYSRSLNQWAPTDAAYNYMFDWDGHNTYWDGRITNTPRLYPANLVNQIHSDGEIWVAVLLQIYDDIGRTKMDKAFLEGLAMTNGNTNQQQAAIALRQAAIDMGYTCAEVQSFTTHFTGRGYVLPALELTVSCPETQIVEVSANSTYTIPDFSTLSSAVSESCDAVIAQIPAAGTEVTVGEYPIEMTATSPIASTTCNFNLSVIETLGTINNSANKLTIFPNPATTVLNIKNNLFSAEKITVFNMIGQKMIQKTIGENATIDINSLSKGVYTIYFEQSKMNAKFIKN